MKKNKKRITITTALLLLFGLCVGYLNKLYAAGYFGINGSNIYNTEMNNAISGGESSVDPIRYGVQTITNGEDNAGGIIGILHTNIISNHMEALNDTLRIVQNIVNYALGLVGLVALIYILFHGFIILTAGDDDSKQKKGIKGIKNGFIAMAGIALSRIIVSFLLRLINTIAY